MNDALDPSPPAFEVVSFLNATINLPKNDRFVSRRVSGDLYEISFNPRKKYTQGRKSGTSNVSQARRSIDEQLSSGKNASATVSSKADAETFLRDFISGSDQKGSYMNTTPEGSFSPQADASDYLPRSSSSKRGTYHWDSFDPNAEMGDHALQGAHLQIHTFEGKIIRIFY